MSSNERYALPRPGLKKRLCLGCDKPFRSSWAGHRICSRCTKRESYKAGADKEYKTPGIAFRR